MTEHHTILFVCELGAAKSVLAAAYLTQIASERGLPFRGVSCGTHPDPHVWPSVQESLIEEGLEPSADPPARMDEEDLSRAYRVVTFDRPELEGKSAWATKHIVWNEMPAVREDILIARAAIRARVEALVDSLVERQVKHETR